MKTTDPRPSAADSKATRLAGYLAGGVASTLLASSAADASVVTLDLTNLGTNGVDVTGTGAGITFGGSKKTVRNLLGGALGGSMDIYFSSGDIGLDADDYNGGSLQFATNPSGGTNPHNFAFGDTIDNATWTSWSGSAGDTEFLLGANVSADFGPNSYMGFRLLNGGNYYYGWFEVTWTYTGPGTGSFEILSGAYEDTANTAILAGSTGGAPAVPGPGGLMALMALGGGAFRRRYRAA